MEHATTALPETATAAAPPAVLPSEAAGNVAPPPSAEISPDDRGALAPTFDGPAYEKLPCPDCGRLIARKFLDTHRRKKHGAAIPVRDIHARAPCPDCGKLLNGSKMARHRISQHGVPKLGRGGDRKSPKFRRKSPVRHSRWALKRSRSIVTREGRAERGARALPCAPGQSSASGSSVLSVAKFFELLCAEMRSQGELVSDCVTGLQTLFAQARALRLAYIKNRAALDKLQRAAQREGRASAPDDLEE